MKIPASTFIAQLEAHHFCVKALAAYFRVEEKTIYRRYWDRDIQEHYSHLLAKHREKSEHLITTHIEWFRKGFYKLTYLRNISNAHKLNCSDIDELGIELALRALRDVIDLYLSNIPTNDRVNRHRRRYDRISSTQHHEAVAPSRCHQPGQRNGCN